MLKKEDALFCLKCCNEFRCFKEKKKTTFVNARNVWQHSCEGQSQVHKDTLLRGCAIYVLFPFQIIFVTVTNVLLEY